jgi:sulfite exporter TauE/SafE
MASLLALAPMPPVGSPATATEILVPAAAGVSGDGLGLAVFFLVGLLGGAHCLGMCGPLVTVYAEQLDEGRGPTFRELRQHAAFNLGRTLAYATLGALLGAVGMVAYDAAAVAAVAGPVRGVVGVGVGLFVLVVGAAYLARGRSPESSLPGGGSLPLVGGLFGRVYGVLSGRVHEWATGPRIVALGSLHALLPCPLLYPAYLYALAQGSPAAGAANLAALGLGTFPTLFAYGTVIGSAPTDWRVRLHRALGAVFLVLGYVPLSMGLQSLGVGVPMLPLPFYQPLG